ncbi:Mob1/phocein [Pluteus cervinus]|uniref:Mob1/phocein n=1 Tax=Pluteus cervinus TaxID=181527 RepID=A0ACD3AS46_9AGAR|nr:Mob1/phocein [Pluteus cervinus]
MTAVIQRPLRGSRISTFYPIKSLPSLSSLDSAFQLQEYISLLIRLDVHDVEAIVSLPGKPKERDSEGADTEVKTEDKDGEKTGKSTDVAVDEACWIYEHLRRLAQDLSHPLITMLQQECTRVTCPEMKAGEWLYLCVAHGDGGATEQCCAIDYILHTLDSATALLNSPRAFPSRLRIPEASRRHFSSLARRLGRIFAHAYFHHREAFEQAEVESSLYARFLALASKFDLVPAEFLAIPPRVPSNGADVQPPRLLGAALDPQGERSRTIQLATKPFGDQDSSSGATIERPKGTSPPGLGSDSPRKYGRHRTDTMVFSEAANVAGELAKYEQEGIGAFPEPSTSHGRGGSRDVEDYRTVFSAIMTAEDDLPGETETSTKYTQELPALYQDEATPGPSAPSELPDADDEPSVPAAESTTTDDAETASHIPEVVDEPEVVAAAEIAEEEEVASLVEESAPTGDELEDRSNAVDSSAPAPGTAPPDVADEPEVSTDAEPVGDEAPKPSNAQEDAKDEEDDDEEEDDGEEEEDGEESDDSAPAPAPAEAQTPAEPEEDEEEKEGAKDDAEVGEAEAATTSAPASGTASEGTDEEVLSTDSDEPPSTA